jgi:hypothetical protein
LQTTLASALIAPARERSASAPQVQHSPVADTVADAVAVAVAVADCVAVAVGDLLGDVEAVAVTDAVTVGLAVWLAVSVVVAVPVKLQTASARAATTIVMNPFAGIQLCNAAMSRP